MRNSVLHVVAGPKICGEIITIQISGNPNPILSDRNINSALHNHSLHQNQAQDTFASDKNVQTIYAYAAIVVAIWQKFPQFGNLFLAMVYKCCPYIVPYFIVQVDGQNEEDYIK